MMPEPYLLYVYAGAGTLLLWGKMAKSGRGVYALSDLLKVFLSENKRCFIEPIVFVLLGTFLSVGIITPQSPAQAFAAGLGWAGLTART